MTQKPFEFVAPPQKSPCKVCLPQREWRKCLRLTRDKWCCVEIFITHLSNTTIAISPHF